MLASKILKEQKTSGLSGALEQFLKQKAGPALGIRNLSQIIEHVKARDLIIQSLLLKTSFEDLGMTEPVEEKAVEELKEGEEEEKKGEGEAAAENAEESEILDEAEKIRLEEEEKARLEEEEKAKAEEPPAKKLINEINQLLENKDSDLAFNGSGSHMDFVP